MLKVVRGNRGRRFSRERWVSRNNCARIVDEKGLRDGFVREGADALIGGRQDGWTVTRVVGIAGDNVNGIALKKPLCHLLRALSPKTR